MNRISNIALIPARSGSKRLKMKNIRELQGIPLIAYSISAAKSSGLFSEVIVSTDCAVTAGIAKDWGAHVPILRPSEISGDTNSDLEWVMHAMNCMIQTPLHQIEYVAILRPTSPLRKSESIISSLKFLSDCNWADSIRAMEVVSQHPGKMWIQDGNCHAKPFLAQTEGSIATYNSPTQNLTRLFVQNASLEIVRRSSLIESKSICGTNVLGVTLPNFEGFDINTQLDWEFLEFLISKYPEILSQPIKPTADFN